MKNKLLLLYSIFSTVVIVIMAGSMLKAPSTRSTRVSTTTTAAPAANTAVSLTTVITPVNEHEEEDPSIPLSGITVYVTKSGSKYHRQDCSHIKNKLIFGIDLNTAKDQGYEPCTDCKP